MAGMTKIGDDRFDAEVVRGDRLTLVDFGATWCGPCKKLHPIMEDLAQAYSDKIKVFMVDVGDSPDTATKYGVTTLPQLLFFRDGVVKEAVMGLLPRSRIEEKIERHLA